jgi:hypothetical protein
MVVAPSVWMECTCQLADAGSRLLSILCHVQYRCKSAEVGVKRRSPLQDCELISRLPHIIPRHPVSKEPHHHSATYHCDYYRAINTS